MLPIPYDVQAMISTLFHTPTKTNNTNKDTTDTNSAHRESERALGISRVSLPAPRKDDLRAAALMKHSNAKKLLSSNMLPRTQQPRCRFVGG